MNSVGMFANLKVMWRILNRLLREFLAVPCCGASELAANGGELLALDMRDLRTYLQPDRCPNRGDAWRRFGRPCSSVRSDHAHSLPYAHLLVTSSSQGQ